MKIKEKLKQFGILVIRAIWPRRASKSVHLGILIIGLAFMVGVTRASAVQEAIASIIGTKAPVKQQAVSLKSSTPIESIAKQASEAQSVSEGSGEVNIVDLIDESELIVRGMVKEVTDGFENGVPYTQVTVQVSEALRGTTGDEYSFRQFGLTQPRRLENGKTYLGITPEGWSKYKDGEDVVLFLCKQASMTGLRTTVGLGQGKVLFQNGNATSQFDNKGLFENVEVNQSLLNDKDKRLLATKKGAVNGDGFMSFVRRAVKNKWIEGGKLRHANK
ncbi:MAG TPA: hypothetical protein VJL58_02575 [Pyrinomonadaceae bacterium]|nr:hypothetical protein [Pyrinomonadaceae bacterium]